MTSGPGRTEIRQDARLWDDRLLFAPLNTLSAHNRRLAIVLGMAFATARSALWNGDLMAAWGLADVQSYLLMAQDRYDLVRQPFTARPLAPLLAGGIAHLLRCWPEGGFEVLCFACLLWTLFVVFWFLSRTAAPRWMLVAVAAVPFWPYLLSSAGLPDPLYAALLCCLLLALAKERLWLAAAMMFPLMLCRESTSLTLLCLLAIGWRRLRWAKSALAITCAALGTLIVRHLSSKGLPNPENLSGGVYMVGKLVANTLRTVGIVPWSNVYPMLCPAPAWQMPIHVGAVRAIGVCTWSSDQVRLAWWAVLTVFGLLPAVLLLVRPMRDGAPPHTTGMRLFLRRAVAGEGDLLLRFCTVYGGISLLLGPILGVSYTRLVGYGWPLLLIAVPGLWRHLRFRFPDARSPFGRACAGCLLGIHLLVCALGLRASRIRFLLPVLGLYAAAAALVWVYRRRSQRGHENPENTMAAW